jgi:diguanylate cyclase (GGDEF)-like protein
MRDEFNVLVIEDNDETFNALKEGLANSRFRLLRATTAKEALKLCKDVYFMAIITESHMPDMNGIELIRRIKKIDNKVNIILMTTYSFIDSAVLALKTGAFAYILKPCNIEEVKLILQRAIENRSLLILAGERKYYQDMSILDGLTGVYNNRHFHEMLEWQIGHLLRVPQAFSLLMIDIDDFKKYNDTYGHLAGDKLLHNTAQLFLNSARGSDMVFRYGGEEFAIIMPQTAQENAKRAGERLLETVRIHLPVTISLGLATFPDNAQTQEELINNADKALYRAKSLGKARLCIYDQKLDK